MGETLLKLARRGAPLIWITLGVAALYVLTQRLQTFTIAQLTQAISAVEWPTFTLGLICCFAAYLILSLYEVFAVKAVTGRRLVKDAAVASWIAHSIGHIIGAALLSGGALRYRRYAAVGLSMGAVTKITMLAAVPYVLGAGWLLDITLLLYADATARALHLSVAWVICIAVIGLVKDVAWLAIVCRRRELRIGRWVLPLPGVRFTLLQIAVGIAEIALAATILYVFMPDSLGLGLIAFTGVFLIAVTLAQLSHVPAGLGVLEAALLLMLPHVAPETLLAAVICFRIVFELFPLSVGAALLVYAELQPSSAKQQEHYG